MKCRQDDTLDSFGANSRVPIQKTNFDDNEIF